MTGPRIAPPADATTVELLFPPRGPSQLTSSLQTWVPTVPLIDFSDDTDWELWRLLERVVAQTMEPGELNRETTEYVVKVAKERVTSYGEPVSEDARVEALILGFEQLLDHYDGGHRGDSPQPSGVSTQSVLRAGPFDARTLSPPGGSRGRSGVRLRPRDEVPTPPAVESRSGRVVSELAGVVVPGPPARTNVAGAGFVGALAGGVRWLAHRRNSSAR